MNTIDVSLTIPDEELWSVFDFARRYRIDKREENRLLMLFGQYARPQDLLTNARRHSLIG